MERIKGWIHHLNMYRDLFWSRLKWASIVMSKRKYVLIVGDLKEDKISPNKRELSSVYI